MSLVLNRLQFEIENLPKRSPYDLELFLEKYCLRRNGANGEVLLHATNTFVLQIKYALTQLYGNVGGFLFDGEYGSPLEMPFGLFHYNKMSSGNYRIGRNGFGAENSVVQGAAGNRRGT